MSAPVSLRWFLPSSTRCDDRTFGRRCLGRACYAMIDDTGRARGGLCASCATRIYPQERKDADRAALAEAARCATEGHDWIDWTPRVCRRCAVSEVQ